MCATFLYWYSGKDNGQREIVPSFPHLEHSRAEKLKVKHALESAIVSLSCKEQRRTMSTSSISLHGMPRAFLPPLTFPDETFVSRD